MVTRCKFRCYSVEKALGHVSAYDTSGKYLRGEERMLYNAKFQAVTSGSEEDRAFHAFTPSGSLEVRSILPDTFVPGRTYYLDITEVPEAEATASH